MLVHLRINAYKRRVLKGNKVVRYEILSITFYSTLLNIDEMCCKCYLAIVGLRKDTKINASDRTKRLTNSLNLEVPCFH